MYKCVCLYCHFEFDSGLKIKFSKFQKILKPVSASELFEFCWYKESKIYFSIWNSFYNGSIYYMETSTLSRKILRKHKLKL